MLKQISKFELKIGEKIYQFFLDSDSPLEHAKEALFQFQKLIGQIEDNVKAQQAQQANQDKVEPINTPQDVAKEV